MKRLYKIFATWFLCLFLVLSQFIVSFADVKSLMIGTSSNAMTTFNLPRSSIASITNTVDWNTSKPFVRIVAANINTDKTVNYYITPEVVDDGLEINWKAPDGYYVSNMYVYMVYEDIYLNTPRVGTYSTQIDLSSDFSYSVSDFRLYSMRKPENVQQELANIVVPFQQSSGDVYIGSFNLTIPSGLSAAAFRFMYSKSSNVQNIGYLLKVRFSDSVDGQESYSFISSNSSNSDIDYKNDVTSSLSDLSSSVDSMSEDLSSAAENLEYISTSQNLIIQGIDNVVMHISDQLFAFWNQLYNLIHVPTMAKMDDIISAIQNMDLEIEVNLDGLKQSIQQASQNEIANDNKISADQIANDEANTEEVKDAVREHGNFIIDGLKGLFIPSDEFFKAYFDDLYAYFSDRFGFLSFPIDLLVRTVNLFINSSDVDAVLTLPSFEISGEQVWADQSFNFTEFLETNFAFLLAAIRTVTSIGMIYAFVNLCQDKWDEVMKS